MSETSSTETSLKQYFSLSLIITFLSQFSMVVYYGRYGLQPVYYYEPSEIIIRSAKDFVAISLFMFLMIQSTALFIKPISLDNIVSGEGTGWSRFYNLHMFSLSVIVFSFIALLIAWFLGKTLVPIVAGLVVFSIQLWIREVSFLIKKIRSEEPERYNTIKIYYPTIESKIITLGITYVFATFGLAYIKSLPETNINYAGSTITLSTKEKIQITHKVLLIGRSKDYLFLYNTPNETLRIIKRSDISNEIIKSKDKGFFNFLTPTY
jgi:hypothetical protein